MSKYELEKTQDKVEFSAYSDDYTSGVIFGRAIGGNYYGKSKVDGVWDTINLVSKDDLDKRFSSSEPGIVYNSVSDFPATGSGFGVNTKKLTLYTGFVIPDFSRICFMNYGSSPDGALIAIAPSGDIYSAFRNGDIWQNGKVR